MTVSITLDSSASSNYIMEKQCAHMAFPLQYKHNLGY